MELFDLLQTAGAVFGLLCLTMVILAVKKQLKAFVF